MVELEIDGVKVEVAEGSMLMDAAEKAGSYVPHFCYHKKLSIAANCRMCLVDVDKAPKPLPACATPVSPGMVVRTKSEKAVNAQKSVMEFLLINHPLDCPICDQGGECQLQDIAVGYGGVSSRYQEEKRVVFHKEIGPLISAQEMSRCIHCTRCVRFGQEVAGVMELGMANRGEHSEILSFVGQSVDSELSGNMIDLCPVGALTSKPFRYQARTWEMARRKSIAAHDSLGSNLVVQVKSDKVMRIVPHENDSVNECWLSDRDRFSYEGLQAADRLTEPMIKKNGQWVKSDWQTAMNVVFEGLKKARRESLNLNSIGMVISPNSTFEELSLAKALMAGIGSTSLDSGLRHHPNLNLTGVIPWLGGSVQELADAGSIVLIGTDLRNDQPLLTQRIRQATKQGASVVMINAGGLDPLMPKAFWLKASPSKWAKALDHSEVSKALGSPQEGAKFLLIGQQVLMSPFVGQVLAKAYELAKSTGCTLGFLGDGANWVGSFVAGTQASATQGKNIQAMFSDKLKAAIVFGAEPDLDCVAGQKIVKGLTDAEFVVQLSAFIGHAKHYADVLLPIAPSTETSGTFINMAGVPQTFKAAVRPLGEARPGWKVLRVLGNLLGLENFDFNSSDEVLKAFMPDNLSNLLNNNLSKQVSEAVIFNGELELAAYTPIYDTDAMVRRAGSLQKTKASKPALAQIGVNTAEALVLKTGDTIKLVDSEGGTLQASVHVNQSIAENTILIPMGRTETQYLRALFGSVTIETVMTGEEGVKA
jgi:NADH-quinone oxidoreductase subunit G